MSQLSFQKMQVLSSMECIKGKECSQWFGRNQWNSVIVDTKAVSLYFSHSFQTKITATSQGIDTVEKQPSKSHGLHGIQG